MIDQTVSSAKQHNWDIIAPELKKFGVKLSRAQNSEIINGNVYEMENII